MIGTYTAETLDMNGHVTRIARYDASDTLLQQSDRAFDRRGRHYRTTDMRYDQSGSLADAVTTLERRRTNQVTKVTDARGNATTSTFDAFHRVSTVTDALGNIRTNTYDLNGNVTAWSIQETDGTSRQAQTSTSTAARPRPCTEIPGGWEPEGSRDVAGWGAFLRYLKKGRFGNPCGCLSPIRESA